MSASLPIVQFIRGSISASSGGNFADDVLWVQGLLNRWLKTRSKPALALDGGFGENTRVVLVDFQREVVKLPQPKGAVAPGDARPPSYLHSALEGCGLERARISHRLLMGFRSTRRSFIGCCGCANARSIAAWRATFRCGRACAARRWRISGALPGISGKAA